MTDFKVQAAQQVVQFSPANTDGTGVNKDIGGMTVYRGLESGMSCKQKADGSAALTVNTPTLKLLKYVATHMGSSCAQSGVTKLDPQTYTHIVKHESQHVNGIKDAIQPTGAKLKSHDGKQFSSMQQCNAHIQEIQVDASRDLLAVFDASANHSFHAGDDHGLDEKCDADNKSIWYSSGPSGKKRLTK